MTESDSNAQSEMTKKIKSTNKHLPEDLVANILSRLPGKDVLRFRCVSKLWNTLIDSHYFIRMHYNVSVRNNLSHDIFFSKHTRCLYTFHFNDNEDIELCDHLLEQFSESIQVLRFCNGLFLLGISENKNKYAIWNPSTRECKELPEPLILNRVSPRLLNYTFCYDSVSDDYKVVLVPSFHITFCSRSFNNFEAYSLKSNSWTQFDQDFEVHLSYMDVVVGGSLHLVGLRKAKGKETIRDAIISIDVSTGEIGIVPKPYDRWTCVVPIVGEFEGRLCFIGTVGNDFVMWLMKDYGVKESWIKLFSISQQAIFPLAYSTNGKKIFLTDDRGHFLTYDLTNRTTTVISDSNVSVSEYANNFVENLVRLSDYGRSNGNMPHGQEEVKLRRKGSVVVMINDLAGFPHRLVLESKFRIG